ncbi:putative glycoprotein [Blechomonas maslovi leishbunyavirus 1]|uniref:Putative glycoprotein n=1 Tax=Blechomonas maslovi leishbunyavirus 1 TaxID=2364199 RepID=A0A386ISB2_9VIRU|nr:putative glycoprotein [Blechomonas maslovi leishbunyavirus 1]
MSWSIILLYIGLNLILSLAIVDAIYCDATLNTCLSARNQYEVATWLHHEHIPKRVSDLDKPEVLYGEELTIEPLRGHHGYRPKHFTNLLRSPIVQKAFAASPTGQQITIWVNSSSYRPLTRDSGDVAGMASGLAVVAAGGSVITKTISSAGIAAALDSASAMATTDGLALAMSYGAQGTLAAMGPIGWALLGVGVASMITGIIISSLFAHRHLTRSATQLTGRDFYRFPRKTAGVYDCSDYYCVDSNAIEYYHFWSGSDNLKNRAKISDLFSIRLKAPHSANWFELPGSERISLDCYNMIDHVQQSLTGQSFLVSLTEPQCCILTAAVLFSTETHMVTRASVALTPPSMVSFGGGPAYRPALESCMMWFSQDKDHVAYDDFFKKHGYGVALFDVQNRTSLKDLHIIEMGWSDKTYLTLYDYYFM